MSTATDELITAYLTDLEREAARLPWHARTELLEDVRSHIEIALAELREEARGGGARGSDGGGAGSGADGVGEAGSASDSAAPGSGVGAADVSLGVSGSGAAGAAAGPSIGAGTGDVGPGVGGLGGGASGPSIGAGTGDVARDIGGLGGDAVGLSIGAGTGDLGPGASGLGGDAAGSLVGVAGGGAGSDSAEVVSAGDASGAAHPAATPSPALSPADELTQVRAILAALGDPSEIVAEALADYPSAAPALPAFAPQPMLQSPPYPLGTLDVCAVALLLLGGFLAGFGWFIGAVLLWTSPRWSRLEKLIGTLILPGGIAGGLLIFAVAHAGSYTNCDGLGHCVTSHTGWDPPGWVTAIAIGLILAAPAATTVYLVNRARLRPGPSASRASLAIIAGVGALGLLAVTGLLVATNSSSAGGGHASPAPADSGGPAPESGYVIPFSSPAQPSSSASVP